MAFGQLPLGEIGGSVSPLVIKEYFDAVIRNYGQALDLYHATDVVNCECFIDKYGEPDPDCDICDGTGKIGGWDKEPSNTFLARIFIDPEMRQDQHQTLQTRIGAMDTHDARIYFEGRWYNEIKVGDLIVWKQPTESLGIEMLIISKVPRFGNAGEIIYGKAYVEKQPTNVRYNATDYVKKI